MKIRQDFRQPVVCQNQTCDHDSHCKLCGRGQYDYEHTDVAFDLRRDDLTWCDDCNGDICGQCDCGHWDTV